MFAFVCVCVWVEILEVVRFERCVGGLERVDWRGARRSIWVGTSGIERGGVCKGSSWRARICMVRERNPSDAKRRMAVGMPTGQGAPFYDPFYRVNINRSSGEDNCQRYFDDFSVFNYLHLPKPQSLSINSPRASVDASAAAAAAAAHSDAKSGISTSGSHEAVCDSVPKLSTPTRITAEPKNYATEPDAGKENQRTAENAPVNAE